MQPPDYEGHLKVAFVFFWGGVLFQSDNACTDSAEIKREAQSVMEMHQLKNTTVIFFFFNVSRHNQELHAILRPLIN